MPYDCFAPTPKGIEDLAAREITDLTGFPARQIPAGVHFEGDLRQAYTVCLWSRFSTRVLIKVHSFRAETREAFYDALLAFPWEDHQSVTSTFAFSFSGQSPSEDFSPKIIPLVAKDALVDRFRDACGERPSVANEDPGIAWVLHAGRDGWELSIDVAGDSLHRRGFRQGTGEAPLKEHLAAAILMRARWPEIAAAGGSLFDPFCGSGTILIEAAGMAGDLAPGLFRRTLGSPEWKAHDTGIWDELITEAQARFEAGRDRIPLIFGSDINTRVLEHARDSINRADLGKYIIIRSNDARKASPPDRSKPGLVATNPPFGIRMGGDLPELYASFGSRLKTAFIGWKAAILTTEKPLVDALGIRPDRTNVLYNGTITCSLVHLTLATEDLKKSSPKNPDHWRGKGIYIPKEVTTQEEMLVNRLRKNLKQMGKWAKKQNITSYRLYDSDLPEYAVAVDFYEGKWVNLQEYAPPKEIDPEKATRHLGQAVRSVMTVLELEPEQVFIKIRTRQKGKDQYDKLGEKQKTEIMQEGGHSFIVNFHDYLDTGIFLDHRITRSLIESEAAGRDFLNLFCYTATASVYAAAGGAKSTTSVDTSATYLDWGEENLRLNRAKGQNRLVREDCLQFLASDRSMYDLIFIDPPTFSNSKSRPDVFDVQRDHQQLLELAARRLRRGGVIYFSTNFRRFVFEAQLPGFSVEDISAKTIPEDYKRNPKIHYCFRLQKN